MRDGMLFLVVEIGTCPNGTAWVDKAYATDAAHQLAECSNAGLCDRSTGQCQCFTGFTGSACQRSVCPNGCSGHGLCYSVSDVALYDGPDYDSTKEFSGDGYGTEYLNWDKDLIYMCECEGGFFGPDCSSVMCPKGDDPLTINQNTRIIQLALAVRSDFPQYIYIEFQGTKVKLPLEQISSSVCTNLLSYKGKFGQVDCSPYYQTSTRYFYQLSFTRWPVYPVDNNLYVNDGNPDVTEFRCMLPKDTEYGADTTCVFTDVQATNIREYVYCSNRGSCNFQTGTCTCFEGFGGPACSDPTYLYSSAVTASPGFAVNVSSYNFSASALQLATLRSASSNFHFIEAFAGNERVFYVRGDGLMGVNKLQTLSGGQTISGGGVYVENSGCTIANSGLNVVNSNPSSPAVKITSSYGGSLTSEYAALDISTISPTSHYFLQAMHQGVVKFSIRSDGAVSIPSAGLYVSGGASIYSGGVSVTGGLTVATGGLRIIRSGLQATGGMTINSGGISVVSGGVQAYGGASIQSGGMRVTGGMTINSGGFSLTGGLSISNGGLKVTGGATVFSGGIVVTGGLTIFTGGLGVYSGGLTVTQQGIIVTGGLTVASGGMMVTGGMTVGSSGMVVSGGMTVITGGLAVSAGMTINSGGLNIQYGGLTVFIGGVVVSGGLTVNGNGLYVTGGATVTGGMFNALSGAAVTGGLTIYTDGAVINGPVTADSATITDLTVTSLVQFDRLHVNSGLTVWGGTYLKSQPIVFSDRRLKTNLTPITGALDKVSKLKGLYFNWVEEGVSGMRMDRRRHAGVLAQDVLRVFPEVVEDKHGEYLSVDYPSLIPLLIEAIRDLKSIVSDLSESVRVGEPRGREDTSIRYANSGLPTHPSSRNESIVDDDDDEEIDLILSTLATIRERNLFLRKVVADLESLI
eukprot:scaffold1268_cov174-Ochromonas_danica.AAC.3